MNIGFLLSPEVVERTQSSPCSSLSSPSRLLLRSPADSLGDRGDQLPSSLLFDGSDSLRFGSTAAASTLERVPAREDDLLTPAARHACRCGEKFTRSIHYLYHVHEGKLGCDVVDGKLFPCDMPGCKSAFKRKTDKAKHQSCVHTKLRPFKCSSPSCDSAFFFGKDERKHFATVRTYPYASC
jgi:hypothetical protein